MLQPIQDTDPDQGDARSRYGKPVAGYIATVNDFRAQR